MGKLKMTLTQVEQQLAIFKEAYANADGRSRNRVAKKVFELVEERNALLNAEGKSAGHAEFIGPFEYFFHPNGDLLRADRTNPLDVWGYRSGGRFESTPVMAERILQAARETFKDYE
jgi:hypothetical protein